MARKRLFEQPQPVIQRWMSRKLTPKMQALVRAYMRWKLPRSERARRKALDQTFETVRYYAFRFEGGNYPALSTLFNMGFYLLLAEKDIQSLKIDMLTHPDEWARKLYARIILLTIYEWDADKVSGRALRQALDSIDAPESLRNGAVESLRVLRMVQRKVRKNFSIIRNSAIAHRDPDAIEQYRAIKYLNVKDVIGVMIEFYGGVALFVRMLTKLTLKSGTLSAFLNQLDLKAQPASIL